MYFTPEDEREIRIAVMHKRAQGKNKVLTSTNWKERVFVLTPKKLTYHEGTAEKRGRLKGEIELSSVKAVECVQNEAFERTNCFQVVYSEYVLYIMAKNEDQRNDWMECIQDEIRENKFLLMEFHPGAYLANKWSCCSAKEKYNRGCSDTFISIEKKAYSGHSGFASVALASFAAIFGVVTQRFETLRDDPVNGCKGG